MASKVEYALNDALQSNVENIETLAEMLAGLAVEGHS
jgi:hypothetical protein